VDGGMTVGFKWLAISIFPIPAVKPPVRGLLEMKTHEQAKSAADLHIYFVRGSS
jgi:hypothetical protein